MITYLYSWYLIFLPFIRLYLHICIDIGAQRYLRLQLREQETPFKTKPFDARAEGGDIVVKRDVHVLHILDQDAEAHVLDERACCAYQTWLKGWGEMNAYPNS